MKEVTEIIEIVFEKVQLERIVKFLMDVLSSSLLKDYQISTDSSVIDFKSNEKLLSSITQSSDGSFYFNFLDFTLKNVVLSKVGFQIYKYNNLYDLNLHVEEREISKKVSISELQKYVVILAEELKASNFYCGYEPAVDEETRHFSGITLGPLKNWGGLNTEFHDQ